MNSYYAFMHLSIYVTSWHDINLLPCVQVVVHAVTVYSYLSDLL